jgi:hypothetical protein
MLLVIPGLLLLLSARTLAQWVLESHENDAAVAPTTGEGHVDALPLWVWGYRTTGLLVIGIGLLAQCFPMKT